jgi:hypothetical protein
MNSNLIDNSLESILEHYRKAFSVKAFDDKFLDEDDLMLVFGLTQEIKSQNKQYWGRELGICWQRIVIELCKQKCSNFNDSIKEGSDEFCDLVVGNDAIDTKYRIGSGDSGTLKKFKQYGRELQKRGYNPVLLILRKDNLPSAITACKNGGWIVKSGNDAYEYVYKITGFDLKTWLKMRLHK